MEYAKELYSILERISPSFTKPVHFYTFGGTALSILGIKKTDNNADINIDSEDEYRYTSKVFESLGFERVSQIRWRTQEGYTIDLFLNKFIMNVQLLNDNSDGAKHIKDFGNIKIYTINTYDLIISKLARSEEQDFEDIKLLMDFENIYTGELINRYKKTMAKSGRLTKEKLLRLVETKFKEWNKKVAKEQIDGIKRW